MTEQTLDMDTDRSSGSSLPPPVPPAPRPPWYRTPVSRDRDRGKVGGVLAGLARAYGWDLRTTRWAVVIMALFLPVVVPAYLVAWLLLPRSPAEAVALQDVLRDRRRVPLIAAVVVVVVAAGLGSLGMWHVFGGLPWGVGLLAVGVLLWLASGRRADAAEVTAPPVPPAPPTGTVTTTAAERSRVERPSRRRVPVAAAALVAVVAYLAIAAAGDGLDWWDVPILTGVVTTLVIVAVAAATSLLVNRSWLAIPLLLVIACAATFVAVASPHLDGGVGERTVRPSDPTQAQTLYDLGIGQLTVDLTGLPRSAEPLTVRARVGIGRLHVVVPDGVTLVIDYRLGAGVVQLDGADVADGMRHDGERTEPGDPGAGVIRLDVEIGMGQIAVDRQALT